MKTRFKELSFSSEQKTGRGLTLAMTERHIDTVAIDIVRAGFVQQWISLHVCATLAHCSYNFLRTNNRRNGTDWKLLTSKLLELHIRRRGREGGRRREGEGEGEGEGGGRRRKGKERKGKGGREGVSKNLRLMQSLFLLLAGHTSQSSPKAHTRRPGLVRWKECTLFVC